MEKLIKNIEFGEKIFNIKDDAKELTLPVVLKVQSQCLLSERKTLAEGDVITIHSRKIVGLLKVKDCNGRELVLFTTCPHKVQLALPEDERKSFGSLKELCQHESRPKFVEIGLDNEDESVKNGDRLKVLLVEKGANGPLFMHFRNERGKHIRLPVDIKATFTACPPDGKEYFLSEIANINKAPLALFIQFVQTADYGNEIFNCLGVVEIIEQNSIELLFMTLKDGGKLHCCVCPVPQNLTGQTPQGYVEKANGHEWLTKMITEIVDIEKLECFHGNTNPLEPTYFLLIQFDKIFSKKKIKDKGKRIQSLAVDSDENFSDKEKKRSSFLAIFKDEKSKENDDAEKKYKKEKKEKKKKKKAKDKVANSKDTDDSEVESKEKLDDAQSESSKEGMVVASEQTYFVRETTEGKIELGNSECDISQDRAVEENLEISEVNPGANKKKSRDEKKKWKFDLKSKFTGHDKKEKKRKEDNMKSVSLDRSPLSPSMSGDGSSGISEPCSPNSDFADEEYELPQELQTIAAQNAPPEGAPKEKEKSATLISRTWKKMKKRRRALSASNMQRSYSDASADKPKKNSEDDQDAPPPVLEPDYPEDIYEQIPGEFMSQDIYEEAVRAYGAYEIAAPAAVTADAVDSGFDELDQKALETLREASVPPPLPGNHPKMQEMSLTRKRSSLKGEKGALISVDSEGFRRFYESMRASEAVMRSWGHEEIEKALVNLQLGHHSEKFYESQVDGSLLIDLDEAVLRDLGLTLFEARKLRKFVFGWRPDSLRDAVYKQKYSKTSKNPSQWSSEMVAEMIDTELGIPEFANFCLQNQVNGDLLRDIVVDEELLNFLLTGKATRLNAVKLKNYVLDGWRPPKRKETRYEPLLNENSDNQVDSWYEPLSAATHGPIGGEKPNASETAASSLSTTRNNNAEKENSKTAISVRKKIETVPPFRSVQDSKREQSKLVGSSSGGVNSLMQKYEKKSSSIDASRPFTKATTSHSHVSSGIAQRNLSNSPFVTNMKKKFSDN